MPRHEPEIAALVADLKARVAKGETPLEEQRRLYAEIRAMLSESKLPIGAAVAMLCIIVGQLAKHAGMSREELLGLNLQNTMEIGRRQ